jgi:protein TonB
MFDKLIESSRGRRASRAGGFLLLTGMVYGAALLLMAVATVFWFNPALAEAMELKALLAPAIPMPGLTYAPRVYPARATASAGPARGFIAPARAAETIATTAPSLPHLPGGTRLDGGTAVGPVGPGIPGGLPGGDGSGGGRLPGLRDDDPPPPLPRPIPPPTPEIRVETKRVSEGVLLGSAIFKPKPSYPPMARQIRLTGTVQVQITIAEDGRVVAATVISGHPILRAAALEAARRWVFSPTRLSHVPVKVQGLLTFNFTLND